MTGKIRLLQEMTSAEIDALSASDYLECAKASGVKVAKSAGAVLRGQTSTRLRNQVAEANKPPELSPEQKAAKDNFESWYAHGQKQLREQREREERKRQEQRDRRERERQQQLRQERVQQQKAARVMDNISDQTREAIFKRYGLDAVEQSIATERLLHSGGFDDPLGAETELVCQQIVAERQS